MSPIVRLSGPPLKPRDFIAKMLSQGLTRHAAKTALRRLLACEWWGNEVYSCCVDRDSDMHALGNEIRLVHISYHRRDRAPCEDWREAQAIKTAVCGPDAEGIALYPSERRVMDTANEYHIWVPFLRHNDEPLCFPIGWPEGKRSDADDTAHDVFGSVQRAFGKVAA